MQNSIQEILINFELCNESSISPYYPCVRDREDISVLRDEKSGLIFLNRIDHIDTRHYESLKIGEYWGVNTRAEALEKYSEDNTRRVKQFTSYVIGKDYIDMGCGAGGMLDLFKPIARSVSGVELQKEVRNELKRCGYPMYRSMADIRRVSVDVISLFHVLEHLTDPIKTLQSIRVALRDGGIIIVEVPHARDVLLQLNSFKAFSLWSEHLILHTRESLKKFLEVAGFSNINIYGFQRYSLANHIGWMISGKPGGQNTFAHLSTEEMNTAYAQKLEATDQTDTLIAIAYV